MANKTNKTTTTNNDNLLSIYGARVSKNGDRLNVSLVKGEDDNKEWYTTSVKLDGSNKCKVTIKDGFAYIKVPMLEDKKKKEDVIEEIPF